uniref:Uncharacterized protein n=1 Tax=Arundo donax TaxID=35708 RepID=A0A0A8ZJS8_ARUDO
MRHLDAALTEAGCEIPHCDDDDGCKLRSPGAAFQRTLCAQLPYCPGD